MTFRKAADEPMRRGYAVSIGQQFAADFIKSFAPLKLCIGIDFAGCQLGKSNFITGLDCGDARIKIVVVREMIQRAGIE
jgi:hypothetical protein